MASDEIELQSVPGPFAKGTTSSTVHELGTDVSNRSPPTSRSGSPVSTPPSSAAVESSRCPNEETQGQQPCSPALSSTSSRDSTLVQSATASPTAPNSPQTSSTPRSRPTWRSWTSSEHPIREYVPSHNGVQSVLGAGVAALTIVTLFYSHRSDVFQRWNNESAFYQWCQGENYTAPTCERISNKSLSPPPLESGKLLWKRGIQLIVGTTRDEESMNINKVSQALPRSWQLEGAIGMILVSTLVILIVSVWLTWRFFGRTPPQRLSDLSMARTDFSTNVTSPSTGASGPDAEYLRRRSNLRAFVPAQTFIGALKSGSQPSIEELDPSSRRSSNPWSRRNSFLTSSNPSIHEHVKFLWDKHGNCQESHHDACDIRERWKRIVMDEKPAISRNGSKESLMKHSSETLSHSRPTLGKHHESNIMAKVKDWWTPKDITFISDRQPAELHVGDYKGGLAYAGAIMAAAMGGHMMERCPVEVPVDYCSLPDSWMPTMPQDCVD